LCRSRPIADEGTDGSSRRVAGKTESVGEPVAATRVISVMTRIIEIAIYIWTDSIRAVRTYIAKPRTADGR